VKLIKNELSDFKFQPATSSLSLTNQLNKSRTNIVILLVVSASV